jgi:isopentenyldiphosphate isomerase
MMDEMFALVDDDGVEIGSASRAECHRGSFRLHGVVHLLVFNSAGSLILQKRSMNKDIQPGKWDTSVGGHRHAGESINDALIREAAEELNIRDARFEYLYSYCMESPVEREFVSTFRCIWDDQVSFPRNEIEGVARFSTDAVDSMVGTGVLTPNFEQEWNLYHQWQRTHGY